MGIVVPHDFQLRDLDRWERLVVERLRDRLRDSWYIFPSLKIPGRRDFELDVVVAHENDGIAVIEVKGHQPIVRDGVWFDNGHRMQPQPFQQAKDNAYTLRQLLRDAHPALRQVTVDYAVAFPRASQLKGELPMEIDSRQVFLGPDLDACQEKLHDLVFRRHVAPPSQEGLAAFVEMFLGNCEFTFEPEALARHARRRLSEISDLQVSALESLDQNRRVCVTGSAGTGKTRLAVAWARRALIRGERVLVTCFNRPLAAELTERLQDEDNLVVGAFLDITREFDGMPELQEPDDPDAINDWYAVTLPGFLTDNWRSITQRFDTVIVDEAQDFHPYWLTLLRQLLESDGPRRLLLVADTAQQIFDRGFELPAVDEGWTLAEIQFNARNTFEIATLIQREFGGAIAPIGGPESEDIGWIEANNIEEASAAVGSALDDLENRDHAARTILVATLRSEVRDRLRSDFAFGAYGAEDAMVITCENVHRTKGLEYDHVILVALNPGGYVDDHLLYVGVSRAVMSLTIIGSESVAERLGLGSRVRSRIIV